MFRMMSSNKLLDFGYHLSVFIYGGYSKVTKSYKVCFTGATKTFTTWFLTPHRRCGGWVRAERRTRLSAPSQKVHHHETASLHRTKKPFDCGGGSCGGCRLILEDRDKYYTFEQSRALCLIDATPWHFSLQLTKQEVKVLCRISRGKKSQLKDGKTLPSQNVCNAQKGNKTLIIEQYSAKTPG